MRLCLQLLSGGSSSTAGWLPAVGLEIHAQILSRSKIFSQGDAIWSRERQPNTSLALFDLALPGAMPVRYLPPPPPSLSLSLSLSFPPSLSLPSSLSPSLRPSLSLSPSPLSLSPFLPLFLPPFNLPHSLSPPFFDHTHKLFFISLTFLLDIE